MEAATETNGERVIAWMLTQLAREAPKPLIAGRPTPLRTLLKTTDRQQALLIRENQRREYCRLKMRQLRRLA